MPRPANKRLEFYGHNSLDSQHNNPKCYAECYNDILKLFNKCLFLSIEYSNTVNASDRCDSASTLKHCHHSYIRYFVRFTILKHWDGKKHDRSVQPKFCVLVKYTISNTFIFATIFSRKSGIEKISRSGILAWKSSGNPGIRESRCRDWLH